MDNEDEVQSPGLSPLSTNLMTTTIAPNLFLLSTYKENIHINVDDDNDDNLSRISSNMHGNIKTGTSSYKCCLCRKIVDDATLTCAKCVNTGRFCPSKHSSCSSKRRKILAESLNSNDYAEFQEYSSKLAINTPPHLQCSDRMFLFKKFTIEKKNLQAEYQTKMEPTMRLHQMSEEILMRKSRLNSVKQSITRLKEENNRGKQSNNKARERIKIKYLRIQFIKNKIHEINKVLNSSKEEICKRNDKRIEQENKLYLLRRQRLNEVYKYVFPIERLSSIEDDLASTLRALSHAQQPIAEGSYNDCFENDETLNVGFDRYQIVNSCLPTNGDYQVAKLLLTFDVDNKTPEADSLHSTLSHELYEVLSALSHACQLINVIAFYLHIALPFRLHQLEFNGDNLTPDRLRADIAKLNANIITSCISQGIPIDPTNVNHTLENLFKLLTFKQYQSRPKPVMYSQQYIDMIEEEVNEISRAYVTDYWFDDIEKEVMDLINSDDWETVSPDYSIPDDPSTQERLSSSPSSTVQPQQFVMSSSISYLRNFSSSVFSSFFSGSGKS